MSDPSDPITPATAAGETAPKPMPSRLPCRWPCLGLAGVALWLLLFSVGVLIDTAPNRERLGLKLSKEPNELVIQEEKNWQESAAEVERRVWMLENPGKESPAPTADTAKTTSISQPGSPKPGFTIWTIPDFLLSMFSFMPLNIGFLCILAAFIGGCSVNKDEIARVETMIAALKPEDHQAYAEGLRRRLSYLTEHPGHSAIRGLVVYLILISGLFVLGSSPVGEGDNQLVDLTQYMRLAGLFSFFGYIAGNDPTVFSSLLNLGSSRLRPPPKDPEANQ